MAKNTLSVLLLKSGFNEKNALRVFKDDDKPQELNIGGKILYYRYADPKLPKWSSFFKNELPEKNFKSGGNIAAVYFVEIECPEKDNKRTFAITFGTGRFFLKQDAIETKFGLLTTLSGIMPESLRLVDTNTIDSVPMSNKTQASKTVGLDLMGFDTDTDVLKGVRGHTNPKYAPILGKNLQGADSLQISSEEPFDKIYDTLKLAYEVYKSEKYKTNFEYFTNLSIVKDPNLIESLNQVVFNLIKEGNYDKIWIAVPEIVESHIMFFGFSNKGNEYDDINLDLVIRELKLEKDNINFETFTKKRIYGFDDYRTKQISWSIYHCLFAEIRLNNKTYALNAGEWYEINDAFAERVNKFYNSIGLSQFPFIPYSDDMAQGIDGKKCEAAYNEQLQLKDINNRKLCDAQNISYGGGHSKIEVCDIYTKDRCFIHNKIYGGSAPLSHLFNQGRVSAQLLKMDGSFRVKVNDKFLPEPDWRIPVEGVDPTQYTIIYGIIQKAPDGVEGVFRPSIPLFSKITLKRAIEELQAYGFNVLIAGIPDQTTEKPVKPKEKGKPKD